MDLKLGEVKKKFEKMSKGVDTGLGNTRFKWGLTRNKYLVKNDMDNLREREKSVPEFTKYVQKCAEVKKSYALRDKNTDQFKIDVLLKDFIIDPELQDLCDQELTALEEEYKDAIEAEEDRIREVEELLQETIVTVDWVKIKYTDVPEDIDSRVPDFRYELFDLWDLTGIDDEEGEITEKPAEEAEEEAEPEAEA